MTKSVVVLAMAAGAVRAGEFTNITHEASGEWWANVFDGGPVVHDSGMTDGPSDWVLLDGAIDRTRSGVNGGSFAASGFSRIQLKDSVLSLRVENKVNYTPSLSDNGDQPGGTGAGGLTSVIEFEMQAEELAWIYQYEVLAAPGFTANALTVVENVTQGLSLLTLMQTTPRVETFLTGDIGDVIRITSVMAGSGYALPDDFTSYRSEGSLLMGFIVPEPGTLCLLAGGLLLIRRRRRRPMMLSVVLLLVATGMASAEEFTNITHEASGEWWTNVFDA